MSAKAHQVPNVDSSRIRGSPDLYPPQRLGALAAPPSNGLRARGQNAEDPDRGMQRRGHLAVLQGDGASLHHLASLGDPASHY